MKYIKKLIYVLLLTVATQVATAQIKILYGPYLQNVKENEATIVWVADKPSIGWVELAPNDGTHYYGEERPKYFDTTNGVKNTSLLHAVKVKALTPGTTYRYRIYSQEVLSHEGINVIYGRVYNPQNQKSRFQKRKIKKNGKRFVDSLYSLIDLKTI